MRFAPLLSYPIQGVALALLFPLLTPLAAAAATVISVGDGDTLRVERISFHESVGIQLLVPVGL